MKQSNSPGTGLVWSLCLRASVLSEMDFRPEEDLSCPICHEIFKDPVFLWCSHSFCNDCVKSWWWDKQECKCPVCKSVSQTKRPPRNLALKNLCEAFVLRNDPGTLCPLHLEKFKLFCLDHQEPVCVICRDSKAHNDHRFRPIDETAQDCRRTVEKMLVPVWRKLKTSEEAKERVEEMLGHVKVQVENTEARVKNTFEKLHRFLHKEEKTRVSALRKEGKIKSNRMRQNLQDLSGDIGALSDTIRVTEEDMRREDVLFLQNYKTAEQRIQESLQLDDPQLRFGDLIDVSKHVGNLASLTWNKMKETMSSTPVTLDPNTAHPHLVISDDLTSVKYGRRQKVPENPERVGFHRCVLGSEAFSSGSHVWDVDVGDGRWWGVGVATWLEDLSLRSWIIKFRDVEYSAVSPSRQVRLHRVQGRLGKIRVHLRCDRRKVSFFDLERGSHLHSFTFLPKDRFYPYFTNGNRSPLRVLPQSGSKMPPLILVTLLLLLLLLLSVLMMI